MHLWALFAVSFARLSYRGLSYTVHSSIIKRRGSARLVPVNKAKRSFNAMEVLDIILRTDVWVCECVREGVGKLIRLID